MNDPKPHDYPLTRAALEREERSLAAFKAFRRGEPLLEEDFGALSVMAAFALEKPADMPDSPSYTPEYIRWLILGKS